VILSKYRRNPDSHDTRYSRIPGDVVQWPATPLVPPAARYKERQNVVGSRNRTE